MQGAFQMIGKQVDLYQNKSINMTLSLSLSSRCKSFIRSIGVILLLPYQVLVIVLNFENIIDIRTKGKFKKIKLKRY